MKKLVIDSSVIVKWLNQNNEQRLEQADRILIDVQNSKTELIAPELAKYEVGNALLIKKRLNPTQARNALATLNQIPVEYFTETPELAKLTFTIAYQANKTSQGTTTYYDASFAALTKTQNATLVTDNPKHLQKIPGINVIPLAEYD